MNDDKWELQSGNGKAKLFLGPIDQFRRFDKAGTSYFLIGNADSEAVTAGNLAAVPDGFGLVAMDSDGACTVSTDRYGRCPMYLRQLGDNYWVSPSLRWLAANAVDGVELAPEAIAQLLTFKFILGSGTILKGIERVPPASSLRWDGQGELVADRYWEPLPSGPRLKVEQASDSLVEAFTNGVQHYTSGVNEVGVTLSGGLDSRAVLAAALRLGCQVRTLTCGLEHGMDHRFSVMAAEAAGVPLTLALQDANYRSRFFELTRLSMESYEGMLLTPGSEALWLINRVAESPGIGLVLHGAMGELAKGATANHFELSRGELEACRKDVGALIAGRYASVHHRMLDPLKPELRDGLRGMALDELKACANGLAEAMDPIDVPFALQITEHFRNSGVYSAKIWERAFPIAFPFTYPDYVDQLLQVRTEDRLDPGFHYTLIGKLHDGLYRCPESNSGVAPSAPAWVRRASALSLKIREKLGFASAGGHTDFCAWINGMDPGIEKVLLENSSLGEAFLDGDTVRSMVNKSRSGDELAASDLYRLLCLDEINRLYT